MRTIHLLCFVVFAELWLSGSAAAQAPATAKPAPKPLFRDPVHDGAADPAVV